MLAQCLVGLLSSPSCMREPAQLDIDQREQFVRRTQVAVLNIIEEARDIAHTCPSFAKSRAEGISFTETIPSAGSLPDDQRDG